MEAERWEGVLRVCRRYGVDPEKRWNRSASMRRSCSSSCNRYMGCLRSTNRGWKLTRDDAGGGQVYEPPGASSAYAVHHCELRNFRFFSAAESDCGGDRALSRQDAAGTDGGPRDAPSVPVEEHAHVACAVVLLRLIAGSQSGSGDWRRSGVRLHERVFPSERVVLQLLPERGSARSWRCGRYRKKPAYFREVFPA